MGFVSRLSLVLLILLAADSVRSQTALSPIPAEVEQLLRDRPTPVASALTPSQQGLTPPSLWWTDQLYGQKLVVNWLVFPTNTAGDKQVNLIVRSDIWSRYTYSERYAFTSHFGSFANQYGYQLLVIDRQGLPLASYLCNLAKATSSVVQGAKDFRRLPISEYALDQTQCDIWFSPLTAQSGF
ncbi:MAG: hypothetical protein WA902_07180 [Thermosynechococcaceae cyanobacterium]